jgi:hypothetical protein
MDAAQTYAGGVILALDVATRTGVAWGEPGEKPTLETIDFSKPLPFDKHGGRGPLGKDAGDCFGRALMWIARKINWVISISKRVALIIVET